MGRDVINIRQCASFCVVVRFCPSSGVKVKWCQVRGMKVMSLKFPIGKEKSPVTELGMKIGLFGDPCPFRMIGWVLLPSCSNGPTLSWMYFLGVFQG